MANFLIAYKKTSKTEGGWVCDADDSGGQTWKGVAQLKHPKWPGWPMIEKAKTDIKFPVVYTKADVVKLNSKLNSLPDLEVLVQAFYREHFWNKIKGDDIQTQFLADKLYDNAVNFGHTGAIKQWQEGVLDVAVTGIMDETTINKLNQQA